MGTLFNILWLCIKPPSFVLHYYHTLKSRSNIWIFIHPDIYTSIYISKKICIRMFSRDHFQKIHIYINFHLYIYFNIYREFWWKKFLTNLYIYWKSSLDLQFFIEGKTVLHAYFHIEILKNTSLWGWKMMPLFQRSLWGWKVCLIGNSICGSYFDAILFFYISDKLVLPTRMFSCLSCFIRK